MELPYFKAFPSDWESHMLRTGIPANDRGHIYRLIFFAWQQKGLELDRRENETEDFYKRRVKLLAQAFGMPACRFQKYLEYYRSLSVKRGLFYLPTFLAQQLDRFNDAPDSSTFPQQGQAEPEQNQSRTETDLKQNSNNFQTEPEQLSSRTETTSEQNENNFGQLSPLDSHPPLTEQNRTEQNRTYTPLPPEMRAVGIPANAEDEARSEIARAITVALGWGLAPSKPLADRAAVAADNLAQIAATYGAAYAPNRELVAGFDAYTKAQKWKHGWSDAAIVTHWKAYVDSTAKKAASTAPPRTACPNCADPKQPGWHWKNEDGTGGLVEVNCAELGGKNG